MSEDKNGKSLPQVAPGVASAGPEFDARLPETVSMPSCKGVEFYSGLRRGVINQLVLPSVTNKRKPPVKSINLRRPGATKGKRLVVLLGHFAGGQMGLLTYLRHLRDTQGAASEKAEEVHAE